VAAQVSSQEMRPGDEGDYEARTVFVRPELADLDRYIGHWLVTEKHFSAEGKEIATTKGLEEILWILDTNAIYRRYNTSSEQRAYKAIGMLTWNEDAGCFKGTWYDNVSRTDPKTVTASWDGKSRTMTHTIRPIGQPDSDAMYRTVEEFLEDGSRQATTFLIQGAKKTKVLEVRYRRAQPCPGSQTIHRIIEG
jgi:hypothetical protein